MATARAVVLQAAVLITETELAPWLLVSGHGRVEASSAPGYSVLNCLYRSGPHPGCAKRGEKRMSS